MADTLAPNLTVAPVPVQPAVSPFITPPITTAAPVVEPPVFTEPAINPFTPPVKPSPSDIAPPADPIPEKPKTAFAVIEPKETPAGASVPPKKAAVKEITAEEAKEDEADQIKSAGVLTVVMVTTKGSALTSNWNAVFLPKDAADLSEVEVHRDPLSTGMDVAVYPNKDEAIGLNPINDGTNDPKTSVGVGSAKAVTFRKMSKALWAVIS